MITHIDPYFAGTSTTTAGSVVHETQSHARAMKSVPVRFSQSRAERESLFEHTHGSLWVPGLLDRLTTPLTRYHE
jgi:hypothetical protein